MRYKNIADTNLCPSVIVLGTHEYGSGVSQENAFEMMDHYFGVGGNCVDTADLYADWQCDVAGVSELTIGRWMKSRKVRDKVVLATKGGSQTHTWPYPRLSREELHENLQLSLQRLGVDYVDIFWLHVDDWERSVEEILETMESFRTLGMLRYYGASNWHTFRLKEANVAAKIMGYRGFIGSQIHWSLADYNSKNEGYSTHIVMDSEIYNYHLETGLAQFAYTPQASGFFGGKYMEGEPTSGNPEVYSAYNLPQNWRRLKRCQTLAQELGCTANQIALAYLTNQPFATFPIVGCWKIEHLKSSAAAGEIELSEEQIEYLRG